MPSYSLLLLLIYDEPYFFLSLRYFCLDIGTTVVEALVGGKACIVVKTASMASPLSFRPVDGLDQDKWFRVCRSNIRNACDVAAAKKGGNTLPASAFLPGTPLALLAAEQAGGAARISLDKVAIDCDGDNGANIGDVGGDGEGGGETKTGGEGGGGGDGEGIEMNASRGGSRSKKRADSDKLIDGLPDVDMHGLLRDDLRFEDVR